MTPKGVLIDESWEPREGKVEAMEAAFRLEDRVDDDAWQSILPGLLGECRVYHTHFTNPDDPIGKTGPAFGRIRKHAELLCDELEGLPASQQEELAIDLSHLIRRLRDVANRAGRERRGAPRDNYKRLFIQELEHLWVEYHGPPRRVTIDKPVGEFYGFVKAALIVAGDQADPEGILRQSVYPNYRKKKSDSNDVR